MKSRTTKNFRKQLKRLPVDVQIRALNAYRLWRNAPWDEALQFKRLHVAAPLYSVRIGHDYRAVALWKDGDEVVQWYWIGTHAGYGNLLKRS